jgi:catechol 2,3-dioxygenase-like lactoylglutathione lyase family enzyme
MFTIKETNVTIMVKDMDTSVDFYQKLGLTIKNRWDNHYAQLVATGIVIGLHPAHADIPGGGNVSIGFIVDDLDKVKTHLEQQAILFESYEDKAGDFANLKDPDGTIIYYMKAKIEW